MLKVFWLFFLACCISTCTRANAAGFADAIVGYETGSGFASGFTNSSSALGAPTGSADPFDPPYRTNEIVSIGAGGSITLHLSTPIVHAPSNPYGLDFQLFGNSFFVITNADYSGGGVTDGSVFGSAATSQVEVSADGVRWYRLDSSKAPALGALFPTDGLGNPGMPVNPSLTNRDFSGLGLTGIRSLYAGSAGGTAFSLAWAQDTNDAYLNLPVARFVRLNVLSGRTQLDAISTLQATTSDVIAEDFAFDPSTNGWRVFGDTNLFRWNATNQDLDVTWDSSQPNSYFYRTLGTILTRADDFSLAFDLRLQDIGPGPNTNKAATFPIAIGFMNPEVAGQTNFLRGTGSNSPDLAEFAYFWDSGFGATAWPTFVSTNSTFNYNSASDYAIFALTPGDQHHVSMTYTSSNQTVVATVANLEGTSSTRISQLINTNFQNFRVSAISISSYNDSGQDAQFAGSVLAHGVVDNVVVTTPGPPVKDLVGSISQEGWQVQFTGRTNWLYSLERTSDLLSWKDVSPVTPGVNGPVTLVDTNAVGALGLYRVRSTRP
jgi:hypothetical protein